MPKLIRIYVIAGLLITLAGSVGWAADRKTNSRLAKAFEQINREAKEDEATEAAGDTTSLEDEAATKLARATFGTGCFWCTEAIFERLKGVKKVVSGYSGGRVANPTYKQVCTGLTGHAEVIHLAFDPTEISYDKLLEVFWRSHDPTTLNRQGEDVGPQYRSAIFYHDEQQQKAALRLKKRLNEAKVFGKPIVTEITKFSNFYPAERYHQDYFARNGRQPYCRIVIVPKLKQFRRVFKDDLKTAR